jgi:SanA protein
MKHFLSFAFLLLAALLAFVFLVKVVFAVVSIPYTYDTIEEVPEAQVVLIPGAAVLRNGGLSPVFKARVDVAMDLYRAGKVDKILVSGDNSTVSHNEVNPVRNYLLEKGIPPEDIFLDHAGFDTYSSMYRARDIFGVESMVISTQSFHLPRAVVIARALGVPAYGVRADVEHLLFRNYVREAFANVKAVMNLATFRKPKFLGDTIPITGEGQEYP